MDGDWSGDGLFTSEDIVLALATTHYGQGPYAGRSRAPVSQSVIASAADDSGSAQAVADLVFTRIGDRAMTANKFRFRHGRVDIDITEARLRSWLQLGFLDVALSELGATMDP